MYLKSLELHGFKSFPDKVTLEFGQGMTAVVGPNGSGKSNIGDAVRWVLGEQSSRMLRGGKMEDVIFGGTELRKPVSFASVTLNIIDDDHTLKTDSENVSVTRKLYRNGQSDYLINGQDVRLKDILELFMDTGLGRDGYSIIGQGRVADIVGSKSNERREIFEEAAGISKFRYKKAESERKLASAEENILRLKDIISELEGRVEPLRVQSEKAKKYLVLAETRKALEISVWARKLSELSENLGELEDRLLIAGGEYEHLENEIASMEDELNELTLKRQQCSAAAEEHREKILSLEKQNAEASADIAVYKNNIMHYNDSVAEIELKKRELSLAGEQLEKTIAEKKALISEIELKKSSVAENIANIEKELSRLNTEADEFSKEISGSSDELNKLYIHKSELKFAIANSSLTKSDAEKTVSDATATLDEVNALLTDAEKESKDITSGILDIENSISEHSNRLGGLSMLYSKKSDQLKKMNSEYTDADIEIRNLTQRRQMLIDLENSMEGFAGSVRQIVKAGKSGQLRGVKGTVAQIISVSSKYSVAIETALGGALQNIVVDNEETAKRGIRLLKETGGGRATFLPLTSVKGNRLNEPNLDMQDGFIDLACDLVDYNEEYRGIINSLLGRIVVAENIDLATNIAKKYGYKFRIITLDGQVINAGGSFTGGSVSRSAGVLSRKNEISELESKLDKLTADNASLKSRLSTLSAEVEKLGYDVEGEKETIAQMENDKVRFDAEHRRLRAAIDQYEERIEEIERAMLVAKKRIAEAELTAKTSEAELIKCDKDISILEAAVSEARSKGDESKFRREELSEQLSEKRLVLVELEKDIEAACDHIATLEGSVLDSKSDALKYDERIAELNALIDIENTNITERENKVIEAKAAVARLNDMIKDELKRGMDYEQESANVRISQRAKSDRKETVSADVSRLTERRDNLVKDHDSIINQLWESYNLTAAEACEEAEPIEDMQDATRRLNEIKNKIRALGSVNTDAIDEYKEVSERYEFMSAQLGDVLNSKAELEKLIASLTKNMKEIFSESFVKINDNFKKIFVELFGGGKAELKLTDPENVLESGIEINVAPPGKVIKNLSLLSGGEQAFVAIAIYFAILKLRPSPFCILDEIEAALDDVNVTRYAQYLRNFTDTTQFICITHRRGTMEESDVLYGVTMQEKGVSKLLRMDVREAALMDESN